MEFLKKKKVPTKTSSSVLIKWYEFLFWKWQTVFSKTHKIQINNNLEIYFFNQKASA